MDRTGTSSTTARRQVVGQSLRDLLRAADEPLLLRASLDRGQYVESVAPAQVTQEEQKRNVAWLGGQHGAGHDIDEHPRAAESAGDAASTFPATCCPTRRPVARHGASGGIWRTYRFQRQSARANSSVESSERFGNVAVESGELAAPGKKLAAIVMLGKPLDAQLCCQRRQAILRRTDPLSTQVDRVTPQRLAQRASTDPIAGFEHDARFSAADQLTRRAQSGQARADDDCVDHVGRFLVGLAHALGSKVKCAAG